MSGYIKRLEERIRLLKNDYRSRNDWNRVRIEIEKHGGKWVAENGTVYELRDGVIYQYFSESGVTNLVITALDALVPYVAELDYDLQFATPDKRKKLLEELQKEITEYEKPRQQAEIIVIVERDWLSKISQKRWRTMQWEKHLRPTQMTLDSRKLRNEKFNPDLIYPGDTFEVTL